MRCSACGASLREADRFCRRCGQDVGLAATPAASVLDPHVVTDRWYHRAGYFVRAHFKATVVVTVIATAIGLGALGVFDEKAVPENASSPGYQMVRDLKSAGDIDNFKAVEPESGWQTEYSLNDGDAHIRFNGSRMEIDATRYEADRVDSIDRVARAHGFTSNGDQS
jgi:hypothetical protein